MLSTTSNADIVLVGMLVGLFSTWTHVSNNTLHFTPFHPVRNLRGPNAGGLGKTHHLDGRIVPCRCLPLPLWHLCWTGLSLAALWRCVRNRRWCGPRVCLSLCLWVLCMGLCLEWWQHHCIPLTLLLRGLCWWGAPVAVDLSHQNQSWIQQKDQQPWLQQQHPLHIQQQHQVHIQQQQQLIHKTKQQMTDHGDLQQITTGPMNSR